MKFEIIFTTAIAKWPKEFSLKQGKIIPEVNGFRLPDLSSKWDELEDKANDDWEDLMHWVIFRLLHRKAHELFIANIENMVVELELRDVKIEYIKGLKAEGYEDLLVKFMEENEK